MGSFAGDWSKEREWKVLNCSKMETGIIPIRFKTDSNPEHPALWCAQMR